MEIVEHEQHPVWDSGDLIDQRDQDGLGQRRLLGLEYAQRALPQGRLNPF